MIFEPDTVKGFKDYLPPISLIRERIAEISKKYFKLYGFLPVETPVIEFDELMKSDPLSEEDGAIADRFRLKDKGGRNLGLRYEFTFQLARLFKQNPNLKLPFKQYQIGINFRDEPIRTGRTRQFTQIDADIIGDSSVNADAECLAVISDILKELNIKNYDIQVNNRKLINEIIGSVRIQNVKEVMRELDKISKLGEDVVKSNLRKYADANQILTLFKLLEKDISFFKENAFEGANELETFIKKSKQYGLKIKTNFAMMRGFGYYTGNIFEFVTGKTSLAAGGRYNNLVGKYLNRQIPAVGISFSIESLMGLYDNKIDVKYKRTKSLIISLDKDLEAIKLAKKLRSNKISCIFMSGKPSNALDYANSYKIQYVVFVGEEEIKKKKFKLKNMSSGDEKLLSEKQLINKLKK